MAKIWRLLVAMAMALGATLFVAPASPANAVYGYKECHEFSRIGVICIDIPIAVNPRPIIPECKCPEAIRIHIKDIREDLLRNILIRTHDGLVNIGLAATNPEKEKEYRELAIKSFQAAAELLGKNEIALDRVGYFNLEKGEFLDIEADKSLVVTAEHLVAGLSILQADAFNVDKAMAEFDAAYAAYSMAG